MTAPNRVPLAPGVEIAAGELIYRASRAGGPGGQHVNTSSTRIELTWDVAGSPSLSEEQRARLLRALAARLDAAGRLRVVASESRSQLRNRESALARLTELVTRGLQVPKKRKRTKPSATAKAARLAAKRRRGELKESRRRVDPDR